MNGAGDLRTVRGDRAERWLVAWLIACVGLLPVACASADRRGAPPPAVGAGAASGDPKETLLAALAKMDGLTTYQAEASVPILGSGGDVTAVTHMEVSVKDNVVYQVTQISGGPLGPIKQETLIRASDFLMRPAAQSITTVTRQGTETVRGGEVTVYHATLDPAKFRTAMSSAKLPAGLAENITAPTAVDYGVGADGYVHSVAFAAPPDSGPHTRFELHDYNSALHLPNPTHIVDTPK